jgi:glycerol-3-phosphate dehydrogenase (NAD(P)+)
MKQLVTAAGGQEKTVLGLAGFGDLLLTATSTQSKNYMTGKEFGCGKSLNAILIKTGYIPEGINTAKTIIEYAERLKCTIPTIATIARIVQNKATVDELISTLTTTSP